MDYIFILREIKYTKNYKYKRWSVLYKVIIKKKLSQRILPVDTKYFFFKSERKKIHKNVDINIMYTIP